MKFDIFSFTRAFPCYEYQTLVHYASIRRLTVVEWIIINAANQVKSNEMIANLTVEELFSTVYRLPKCEPLVRTSIYELRSRSLIEINDFDEFSVSSIKFCDIRITEQGENAIANNYIPSESQARDELLYHNLSFDLISSTVKENDDPSIQVESANSIISEDFPREEIIAMLNSGRILDSKYAALQYIVEDLTLLEKRKLSELITFHVSIDDGQLVSNYDDCPSAREIVKKMLSTALVIPSEYTEFNESAIKTRNIAVGDKTYELISSYANDIRNKALFSSKEVYKSYNRHFKKLPDGKVWFVFDDSKETFEISVQTKSKSMTVYIPKSISNLTTILGGTSSTHIVANKYLLPFGPEKVDCIVATKESCRDYEYINIVETVISKFSSQDLAYVSLYVLPVLGGEVYSHLAEHWTDSTTLSKKISDFAEVHRGIKNLQFYDVQTMSILHSLVSEYNTNAFDEVKAIAEKLAKDFELTKEQKGELGLCLLAKGTFEKSYASIDAFLTELVGTIAINDESFTMFEEYGNALYTPSILRELFTRLALTDVTIPSPWSKYEVAFIKLLLSMERIRKDLAGFHWHKESEKNTILSSIFAFENPQGIVTEIQNLHSLIESINDFNGFNLKTCESLSAILKNADMLFDIASHLALGENEGIREIYVIDTCALLNHPDLLDYFSNDESIIIPAIVESELGTQKKKNPTAQDVIRSIEKHRLANEQFGYERCKIESAHMDLISEHDFFKKQNDPRVISVARYYIAFNPVIITDDIDMRNLASSLKICAVGSNDFLKNHNVAVVVSDNNVGSMVSTIKPEQPASTETITNLLEELLDAPIFKHAKRFGITAAEISLMTSNKIRNYSDFHETSDDSIRAIFGKKLFLSNHLLEAKKKVKKAIDELKVPTNTETYVDISPADDGVYDNQNDNSNLITVHPTVEAIDDIASKNGASAGYIKDVLIINIFNHHFSVTEKLQDKRIFRDFLSLGIGIGKVFKDIDEARAFAEAVKTNGQYRYIVEVDYADFLKDQGFDMWVVTLKKFRDRFSVFLSFKNEDLTRSEILEMSKYGKQFKHHTLALEYAKNIVAQFNNIFDNNDSTIIEETIVEVDVENDIIYDHYDEPLYLCNKDSKQLLWRDDELQYQFIDVANYLYAINRLHNDRLKGDYSFAEIGAYVAFETAMETSLPGLHSEVYRVETFLELLRVDTETNQCDIEFYTSYIQTLLECIELQKQYLLPDNFKFSVLVYDTTSKINDAENYKATIPAVGVSLDYNNEHTIVYDIIVYNDYNTFIEAANDDLRQIVFIVFGGELKESSFIEIQTQVYDKTQKTVYSGKEMKDISNLFKYYIRLPASADGIIDDEWINDSSTAMADESFANTEEDGAADDETVAISSIPDDTLTVEAETMVKPPVEWHEDNTLYIYKTQPKCIINSRDIIQVTAMLIGFENREIKMNVSYCRNCEKFFVNYTTYELYRNRYGILLGNLILEGEKYQGEYNDVALAEASPLKLCGYTVNQSDGYTAEQRRYIISSIISRGIMSKGDVIRYLEYFININGRRSGNELALSKWKDDLAFALQYDMKNQSEISIKKIATL